MRAALAAVAALALLAPAPAAAKVKVMVVGKQRVLGGPASVSVKQRTVRVAGRRCAVPRRTALSALLALRLDVRLRDYGSCSTRPRDAGGLYVRRVEADRAKGRHGWVYKVGRRLATSGAGDPAGPFGSGRLRKGARVTWFWCRLDAAGDCPRTLATRHERSGDAVRVTVTGYDDRGRGVPVPGATVRLGDRTAATGPDGTALLSGTGTLTAAREGFVPAFPVVVR